MFNRIKEWFSPLVTSQLEPTPKEVRLEKLAADNDKLERELKIGPYYEEWDVEKELDTNKIWSELEIGSSTVKALQLNFAEMAKQYLVKRSLEAPPPVPSTNNHTNNPAHFGSRDDCPLCNNEEPATGLSGWAA